MLNLEYTKLVLETGSWIWVIIINVNRLKIKILRIVRKVEQKARMSREICDVDQCAFNKLFERNVGHILEMIFLSLDYESLRNCRFVYNMLF